jgi:hypothetical protein
VLIQLVAGGQRDQSLAQYVFMAAVHGVRAAPTGGLPRDLQLLTGEGGERRLLHECAFPVGAGSEGLAVAEELVVLVVAAVAAADAVEVGDELDTFDPLDHLEAQLDFVA